MFYRAIIILAIIFFVSCSRKQGHEKVIPKDVMVPLLVDIHLAEAQFSSGNPFEGGRSLKIISAYDSLFTKYKVQPEDFYNSFGYYRKHPAQMDTLYQDVITELTKRESEISKKVDEEKKQKNLPASDKAKKPKPLRGEP